MLVIMFALYFTTSGDTMWQQHSPYESDGYRVMRSETSGIFARKEAKPIPAKLIKDAASGLVDPERTKDAFLAGIGCATAAGVRCNCYRDVVTSVLAKSRSQLDRGATTWAKTWKTILDDSVGCVQLSANWELQVETESTKVLMGVIVWWAFSITIIAFHIFIDWDRDDWFYRSVAFVVGILAPTGIGGYLIYTEEGFMSMWFILYAAFIVQHVVLKVFITMALGARNDDNAVKDEAAAEFDKKNVMSSMTAFAVLSAARLSQLMSGSNDLGNGLNIVFTALAIGLLSTALRLICGALEVFEMDFKDKPASRTKNDALDHHKALVFSAQWIWAFTFVLGLMLMTMIAIDSGDGLFGGAVSAKLALGFMLGALVLQFPQLTSSHYQWLGLQLLEGCARLIVGGMVVFYLLSGKRE